jgi:hypothetical protein
MRRRYPRLRASRAVQVLLKQERLGLYELGKWPLPDLSREMFAPTGPAKVIPAELLELRAALDRVAVESGYPAVGADQRRLFDRNVARLLGERGLPVDEMLRADTWTWIAVHLAPHLVRWRWQDAAGSVTTARYNGILQRNALGRLWYRAHVLDQGVGHEDRWALSDALNEDAAVQLLERTAIASDRRLSRCVIKHWIEVGTGSNAEAMLREGLIRIRIQGVMLELAVLEDAALEALVATALCPVNAKQNA